MGRELDPELDLWQTAKPYLETWMRQRVGLSGLRQRLRAEASLWSQRLPELPRLMHANLSRPDNSPQMARELERLELQGAPTPQLSLFAAPTSPTSTTAAEENNALCDALAQIDPDSLTPREALEALYRLKAIQV